MERRGISARKKNPLDAEVVQDHVLMKNDVEVEAVTKRSPDLEVEIESGM